MRELSNTRQTHSLPTGVTTEHTIIGSHEREAGEVTVFDMWYRILRLVEVKYDTLLQQVGQRAQKMTNGSFAQFCPAMNRSIMADMQYSTPESDYSYSMFEDGQMDTLVFDEQDLAMLRNDMPTNFETGNSQTSSGISPRNGSTESSSGTSGMTPPGLYNPLSTENNGDANLGSNSGRLGSMQGFLVGGLPPLDDWGSVPLFGNGAGSGSGGGV
jgi:hypothetical protein